MTTSRLTYTGLVVELEHLKIHVCFFSTRLEIDSLIQSTAGTHPRVFSQMVLMIGAGLVLVR
jgi:hypothetical protein